jgi:hypothetical protein
MRKIIIITAATIALLGGSAGAALALTSGGPDNAALCRTATEKLYVELEAGGHPSTAEPASCKALPEKVRVKIAYDVLHGRNG